jgi:HlyD family secretion protein
MVSLPSLAKTATARIFISTLVIAAAFVAGLALAFSVRPQPSQTSENGKTDDNGVSIPPAPYPRNAVHALGRLEPASRILELAPESGNEGATVSELLVQEGDNVRAGTVLAVFDNVIRRQASLAEAQARLDVATAKLEQVRSGAKAGDIAAQKALLALALQQSSVAQKELNRAIELHERKALSSEELDNRQWALDRLKIEQQRAQGSLDSLQEVRETDVRVAAMEVDAAKAAVNVAEADLRSSSLRAPVDGRILRIHTRVGERLDQDGIIEMGDVDHMHAVAEVFEADVALVSIGMTVDVLLDGSGEQLSGTVVDVGHIVARKIVLTNDPVSDTDARVVEVRVALDAASIAKVARLSNARVEAFIRLNSHHPASDLQRTTSTN